MATDCKFATSYLKNEKKSPSSWSHCMVTTTVARSLLFYGISRISACLLTIIYRMPFCMKITILFESPVFFLATLELQLTWTLAQNLFIYFNNFYNYNIDLQDFRINLHFILRFLFDLTFAKNIRLYCRNYYCIVYTYSIW